MKSIRSKLWTGMMALVIIVLLLLWLFQVVFLESFYTNMRISNVKDEANSIIKVYLEGKNSEFTDRLDAFAYDNNLNAELLDTSGREIYTTGTTGPGGQMPMMMNNASKAEVYSEAMSGVTSVIPVTHPRFGNKFMMIGLPVESQGKLSGVMIINMPIAPVEETASILKWQLFYITIILLIASVIISFLISRGFSKPILEIKRASEKIASGDFSVRISAHKQDEIGNLADTINHMANQLSKIENLRKDLIANVSHELRTPLSLIRGYAETIKDVTGNIPEKRERQLDIIIDESERLGRMVDDILNLSQLQAGYVKLNKESIPVNEMLDKVVKRYELISENSGVEIIKESVGPDTYVAADRGRIEQVFYNLINNAFNHTPPGGIIKISSFEQTDSMRFEVSDTGSGIPEDELPYIWDRFYKADKTGSKKSVGTGLGLAIVKGVLDAHEAKFGVISTADVGTTFWFELKKS